jgi:ComF family protein
MIAVSEIKHAFLHLLFPHICTGCGSDNLGKDNLLCIRCLESLPATNFEWFDDNPVEKIFTGRLPLICGSAGFYFNKGSVIQHLLHQLKYKGNKDIGWLLGKFLGEQLLRSGRFQVDAVIPLPLFPAKEKRRGYNQALIICQGMAEELKLPVLDNVIIRPEHTETQTKKGRIERWKNIEGKFFLAKPELIENKHILLVDDVITTGATLEACGNELLKAANCTLSIAGLCVAVR